LNEDTKFPEACHHSESAPETHIAEDVDDWFKACIEDYPYMKFEPGNADVWRLYVLRTQWFMKWFSQFKEDE